MPKDDSMCKLYPYLTLSGPQVQRVADLTVNHRIEGLAPGRLYGEISVLYRHRDIDVDHKFYIKTFALDGEEEESLNDHDGSKWTMHLMMFLPD